MSYRRSRGFDVRVSVLSILVTALACTSARPEPAIPRTLPAPPKPRVVWSRWGEVQSWPSVGGPFPNAGHPGAGARAVVRVSPEARPSYEHLVRDSGLPDGTTVALFHELASGQPGAIYVMEKAGGAWQFSAWNADGSELAATDTAGASAGRCRRCHADGVADSLFGPPRRATSTP